MRLLWTGVSRVPRGLASVPATTGGAAAVTEPKSPRRDRSADPSADRKEITRASFLRLAALSATGLAVPGLAACDRAKAVSEHPGPQRPVRPRIRLGSDVDLGIPSPFTSLSSIGYSRMLRVFDTLIWVDRSGKFLPWLATDWGTPDDGSTWQFTLRRDVQWHDGVPLTARDVAFSFSYLAAKSSAAAMRLGVPMGIRSARAVSDTEVEITLTTPLATFLRGQAAGVPIIPQHIWSRVTDPAKFTSEQSVIGSGPYRVETRTFDGSYDFFANDRFFLGKPFVRQIREVPIGNAFFALRTGEIDAAMTPVGATVKALLNQFRHARDFRVIRSGADVATVMKFNMTQGPLADVRVRQAIAFGLKRKALVDRAVLGYGWPGSTGLIPPTSPFHAEVEQYPYDTIKAKNLLDQAGYRALGATRTGPAGPLNLVLTTAASNAQIAELIAAELVSVGLALDVEAVEDTAFPAREATGKFQLLLTSIDGVGGDPDFLRAVFAPANGGPVIPGFSDAEFSRLLTAQTVAQDEGERQQMINRIQQILAERLPMLAMFYLPQTLVFRPSVFAEWYFTPGGLGTGAATPFNKQVFVTGRQQGVQIRPFRT